MKPLAQRALVLAALLATLAGCGLTIPPRSIAPHKEIEAIGVVASEKVVNVGSSLQYTYTFDDGRTYTMYFAAIVGGPSMGDLLIAGSKPSPWNLVAIPQDPPSWPVGCYKIAGSGEEHDTTVDLDIGVTLQKAPDFHPIGGRASGQTRIWSGAICLDRQGRVTEIYFGGV